MTITHFSFIYNLPLSIVPKGLFPTLTMASVLSRLWCSHVPICHLPSVLLYGASFVVGLIVVDGIRRDSCPAFTFHDICLEMCVRNVCECVCVRPSDYARIFDDNGAAMSCRGSRSV